MHVRLTIYNQLIIILYVLLLRIVACDIDCIAILLHACFVIVSFAPAAVVSLFLTATHHPLPLRLAFVCFAPPRQTLPSAPVRAPFELARASWAN